MLPAPPQHGGRILGAGVYGCTFEPAPRCAGGSVFKTVQGVPAVGKLTQDASADELVVGRKIMALPLAKNYFALPTEECKPELPVGDEDAAKCELLTKKPHADAGPLRMLIMPMAGTTLYKKLHDRSWMARNFISLYAHIFEGMLIYQSAGFVHNDLHTDNVLVDSLGVPRIIDFGQSFNIKEEPSWQDIKGISLKFHPKHAYPPEVLLRQIITNRIGLDNGVSEIYMKNRIWRKLESAFPSRKSLGGTFVDILQEIPTIRDQMGREFIQKFGYKFDSWDIGINMWGAWDYLLLWPQIVTTPLWAERALIRRVIAGLTEFNPKQRLTVREALLLLDPNNRIAAQGTVIHPSPAALV